MSGDIENRLKRKLKLNLRRKKKAADIGGSQSNSLIIDRLPYN